MPNPRRCTIYCNSEKVNFYMLQIWHGPSNTVKLLLYSSVVENNHKNADCMVLRNSIMCMPDSVQSKAKKCTLYPGERGPTTECRLTPHFGLNFLQRSIAIVFTRIYAHGLENAAKMAFL